MSGTEGSAWAFNTIVGPSSEWSNWCARVHPTRPELPILAQSTLTNLAQRKDQALAVAKRSVDAVLNGLDQKAA